MSKLFIWVRLESEEIPSSVFYDKNMLINHLKDAITIKFPTLEKVNNSQISVLHHGNVCEVDDSVVNVCEGNTKKDPLVVKVPQGIF